MLGWGLRFPRALFGVALCWLTPPAAGDVALPNVLPKAIAIGSSDVSGPIYTTADGMTLYQNSMDKLESGTFGCTDARHAQTPGNEGHPIPGAAFRKTCIDRWRPYRVDSNATAVGEFDVVRRPDGIRQWSFNRSPLYTSSRDLVPGDVNGTMGFSNYGRWRTVPVSVWFPPGIELVRKVQGLLLAGADGTLIFTPVGQDRADDKAWLPVSAPELAQPRDEFAFLERVDGSRQWAFRGMALYRPRADLPHHQLQSSVESGAWQAVVFQPARPQPSFVTMHMSVPEIGWVYADSVGQTLYAFYCFDRAPDGLHCDEPGDAAAHRSAVCGTGEQCAREWRPVEASADAVPVGNWGIADVPHPPFADATAAYGEGVPTVRAWTWHGRPVYTFAGDQGPGDVLGHGIEARSSGFGAITVLGDEFPAMP